MSGNPFLPPITTFYILETVHQSSVAWLTVARLCELTESELECLGTKTV